MGIKKYKPHTPGLRTRATLDFSELTTDRPEKSLTSGFAPCAGRGASGRISVRRRGGGHKRKYRIIDFRRDKFDVPGKVVTIEYDPNRSANIALINYVDGEKRYILAPKGLKVGDMIQSGPAAPIKVGNALPLENIPLGVSIHNIELVYGKGGQLLFKDIETGETKAIDKDSIREVLDYDLVGIITKAYMVKSNLACN